MFDWEPAWTQIDDYPSLVTSYTIDRGRQYELDRTDTGRATVQIADRDGILDPTNPDGPYYGQLEPLLQAAIARWDPVRDEWFTRYRGFIEELDYNFDPSQRVNRLTISLVDIFEIISAIEFQPGPGGLPAFGDVDPALLGEEYEGKIIYMTATMQDRIGRILRDAHIPSGYWAVFTGNVGIAQTVYSGGESLMGAIQEAADAEFPGVSNVYTDRYGRLAAHGRLAKFSPETVAPGAGTAWSWHRWKVGDGAAVAGDVEHVAQLRQFSFNRGRARIINSALAAPQWVVGTAGTVGSVVGTVAGSVGTYAKIDLDPIPDGALGSQLVQGTASIGVYGLRSWSATNLQTYEGYGGGTPYSDALAETKRFASYYVANYATPRNRITEITFRPLRPTDERAPALWRLLTEVDISDEVTVEIASPGGGGFPGGEDPDSIFYVEGVHEQARALNANYDDVTISLDLSPKAYFTDLSMFDEAP